MYVLILTTGTQNPNNGCESKGSLLSVYSLQVPIFKLKKYIQMPSILCACVEKCRRVKRMP
jgi:hypothetical protein